MGHKKADLIKRRDKKSVGAPPKYCPRLMAKEIEKWGKEEDSISIAQFCAERGYLPDLIWRLDNSDPDFHYAYQIAKLRLAARRERMLNEEVLNYGAYQRYQSGYDAFLAKFESDEKDKDAVRRKGVVEAEQMNLVKLARLAAKGNISQKD